MLLAMMPAWGQTFDLEGKIGDRYSIVMQLAGDGSGTVCGRYAYRSTLDRDGDVPCSWLYLAPDVDSPYSKWLVTDCHGKHVETWTNVDFTDRCYLTAKMSNVKGRSYDVVAAVVNAPKLYTPLNSYFKEHIGEYMSEFKMFDDSKVKGRLQDLMGIMNVGALRDIIQVEFPVEYSKGMYWGAGFMAHQCCDPAAVWAYDTQANSFYVWVLKDGGDHWWSETGDIPLKFQELVRGAF